MNINVSTLASLALAAVTPLMTFAETPAAAPAAAPAAEQKAAVPARPKMTPEQRAEMKARREKFMAERKAAMEAKMLEVVKKYVPEEEKAKALVKELVDTALAGRRAPKGHRLPPPARPAAPAPAAK